MSDVYIVTGSRDWEAASVIRGVLCNACPRLVVQGGARGADAIALTWAKEQGVNHVTFNARWSELGKRAGTDRNIRMLEAYPSAVILAFPLSGPGTRHCIREAKRRGMTVRVYDPEGRLVL